MASAAAHAHPKMAACSGHFSFVLKFHTSRLILSISAILAVLHVKRDEQTKPDMMLKLVKTNE
jgi:hypothetical protein